MASLEVFGDEIAHLILQEHKSRKQIYDHLVAKYGAHKGLSHTSVKRYCRLKGFERPDPRTKTINSIKQGLNAARLKVQRIEASASIDPAEVYAALTGTPEGEEQPKFNAKFQAFAVSHMSQAQKKNVNSRLENNNRDNEHSDSDNDSSNEELITDLDSQEVEASLQSLPQEFDQNSPNQQQEFVQNQSQVQTEDHHDVVDVNYFEVTSGKKVQDDKLKNPTPVSVQKVAEPDEFGESHNLESNNLNNVSYCSLLSTMYSCTELNPLILFIIFLSCPNPQTRFFRQSVDFQGCQKLLHAVGLYYSGPTTKHF